MVLEEYGRIVIGYQGIGKSTLSFHNNRVIDLESSNFFVDGVRPKYWYIMYYNIAKSLYKQGYVVCLSSHKEVRDWFTLNPVGNQVIVYPSHTLKEQWIKKLRNRFEQTQSMKDFKAFRNADDCFDENITDLENQPGFEKICFDSMDYDLSDLLKLNVR